MREAKDTVMSDKAIEAWLLNRFGEGNRFEQFNRQLCKDLCRDQALQTESLLKEQWKEESK